MQSFYSQAGNVWFPVWEYFIPGVGIMTVLNGKAWHLFRVKRLPLTKKNRVFQIVSIPHINFSECLYIKDFIEIYPSLHPSHNPPLSLTSSLPPANIII